MYEKILSTIRNQVIFGDCLNLINLKGGKSPTKKEGKYYGKKNYLSGMQYNF